MLLFLVAVALPVAAQRADPVEFFETKVRPVFAKNCFSCHTQTKLGGLEMVSRDSLLKGGRSGPAIDTDRPDSSLLVKAIRHEHDKLKMPPTGNKLSTTEIADIVQWIGRGAVWPVSNKSATKGPSHYTITKQQREWWAFQPVRKPAGAASIDSLLQAARKQQGLTTVAPASRRDWIRRVTYDLTGLPPTATDVQAFLTDRAPAPQARAKVVDRLLASPHYGERFGRHWLDVARYSDDLLNSTQDQPYDNAFRYRDWVIEAFNRDMPYNTFVKAQIAGDQLPDAEKTVAGLGFFALSPQFQDDRVEVTGKAFLALTVACAQCHDHKFDPIPTKDYYGLLGVFTSTEQTEFPLASKAVVEEYKNRTKAVEEQQTKLDKYAQDQADQLAEILAHNTAEYVRAVRSGVTTPPADSPLDKETLERFTAYLKGKHEHTLLDAWEDESKLSATAIQQRLLDVLAEHRDIEEKNFIRLGGSNVRGDLARADLLSLPRDKYLLWRDIFSNARHSKFDSGIFYYKPDKIDRFLSGAFKAHLTSLRAELDSRKKAVPERYPYYHIIKDREKLKTERVRIRGSVENLGEEAPRRFLTILCDDTTEGAEPKPFTQGSGRLELANAIVNPTNPLTSRVIANRLWYHLFGQGIVRTLSNFGQLGEKPSHPEVLDYLAARLVENNWSLKALIREITLSETYALGYANHDKNFTADPDNRYLWRATRRRLDIEALRDSLLAASGELEATSGGKPLMLSLDKNNRRTVYGFVSRRKLDGTLSLFDFPNPNSTSEQRIPTATPLQQLFFLNSKFLSDRAEALAARLQTDAPDDPTRIRKAYRSLFQRDPDKAEIEAGLAFLKATTEQSWPQYAQVLLSSNEFVYY
jgi:hypothetical protein